MILYEAPHHLKGTLKELYDTLGNRRITLCRELTKKFETVFPTTLQDALEYYESNDPRGEYVLVLEGKSLEQKRREESIAIQQQIINARKKILHGLTLRLFRRFSRRNIHGLIPAVINGGIRGVSRAALDQTVLAATNELDAVKRAEYVRQAQQFFVDQTPMLPLYFSGFRSAVQPYVSGYEIGFVDGFEFNNLVVNKK